jgi:hypothetical protein
MNIIARANGKHHAGRVVGQSKNCPVRLPLVMCERRQLFHRSRQPPYKRHCISEHLNDEVEKLGLQTD